jgi:hypothetical protein
MPTIYDPQNQLVIDKSIAPAQGIPMDARTYYYDQVLEIVRPYQNVAEVNDTITKAKFRKGHFPVIICVGGALQPNGTFVGGTNTEYWYRDGIADGSLVEKGSGAAPTDLSGLKPYRGLVPISGLLQNNEWIGATFLNGRINNGDIFLTGELGAGTDTFDFDDVAGTLIPDASIPLSAGDRYSLLFKNVNI